MTGWMLAGAGGAVGAALRYLIGLLPMNPENGFPIKTLLINLAGSFTIGMIAALAAKNAMNPKLVVFLKAGVCGGFTTFSSFALETQQLAQKGEGGMAFLYVLLSVLLGVSMVFLAEKAVWV